jgi:hypothetical protein
LLTCSISEAGNETIAARLESRRNAADALSETPKQTVSNAASKAKRMNFMEAPFIFD